MSHKTAINLGWFLVTIGLLFLLYQLVPWEVLTPEDRAIILISSGLILLGCYFALGWVESSIGKELVRAINTFVSILALLTILLSITYFFPPLALLTQMGTEEASRTGQTSISVGEISKLSLEIDLINGNVVLKGYEGSQILIQYEITTRGFTKKDALNKLNKTEVYVSDSVVEDLLNVKIGVSGPEINKVWTKVDLAVSIPSDLTCEITYSTLNGKLQVFNLSGSKLSAEIANGKMELSNIYFDEVDAGLTNGEIKASVSSKDLELEVINGETFLEVIGNTAGRYSIDVVNGNVVIKCNVDEEKGFEFDISTMHGTVEMGLEDFDFIKWDDRKGIRAKTQGYSLAQSKIEVLIDVVNGSIDVRP